MAQTNLFSLISFLLLLCVSTGVVRGQGEYPCIQKLMSCASFLKSTTPPATCCDPLKKAIETDAVCLCGLFNNEEILKSFHVTPEEALQLPKHCGIDADLSDCKASGGGGKATPPSPPTPARPTPALPTPAPPTPAPPTPAPPTPSTNSSSSSGGHGTKSAAASLMATGIVYLTMSF